MVRGHLTSARPAAVVARLVLTASLGSGALRAQAVVPDTLAPRPTLTGGVSYTGALVADAAGGARRGAVFLGAAAVQIDVRLDRLIGWRRAHVFVFALGTHGGAPSDLVGDVQGVNDLQAPPRLRLEEAWIEQALAGNRVAWLAGRYDLNSEFDRLQSGALFLNSSFGMGPEFAQSGVDGPSIFPNTALGARLAVKPSVNSVWRSAVLDATPVDAPGARLLRLGRGGALVVSELALLARPDSTREMRHPRFQIGRGTAPRPYAGKLGVGAWYYSGRFPAVADSGLGAEGPRRGNRGMYLIADRTVWSAPSGRRGWATVFAQLGVADRRANRIGRYAGGGVTVAGVVPRRSRDMIGGAVASARLGGQRAETTLELTYDMPLGACVVAQPDLQYVIRPGNAAASRAVVPAIRVAFSR